MRHSQRMEHTKGNTHKKTLAKRDKHREIERNNGRDTRKEKDKNKRAQRQRERYKARETDNKKGLT